MDSSWIHDALFWALALVLLAAPLWPAWREWRHPTDLHPLPVVRHHSGEARNFAQHFNRWLSHQALGPLQQATARGDNTGVLPMGRQAFRLLGAPVDWLAAHAGEVIQEGVLSLTPLAWPAATTCRWEVASPADVSLGEGSRVRAVACGGVLTIGPAAQVWRWADAAGDAQVHTGAQIWGRLTAGRAIHLAEGVAFTRLSAPRIAVGRPTVSTAVPTPPQPWTPDAGVAMDDSGRTWRYPRALRLPAGAVVRHQLVVQGDLHIGSGARIEGDLKVHGTLHTEEGVRLLGAVVASAWVRLGPHSQAAGPIVGEQGVHAGLGARLGSPEQPTSVSADHILLAQGVQVFGSVWARQTGETEPA